MILSLTTGIYPPFWICKLATITMENMLIMSSKVIYVHVWSSGMCWQWSSWIISTPFCQHFVMYYEIIQILLKKGYFGGHFVFGHILNCSTLTKLQFSVWSSAMPKETESIKKKTYFNKTRCSSVAAGLQWPIDALIQPLARYQYYMKVVS